MKNVFENGKLVIGCNYWASHAGIRMWENWNEEVVRSDIEQLSKNGVKMLRVFPLWSVFQPVDKIVSYQGSVEGYTVDGGTTMLKTTDDGVDVTMLTRFNTLLDIAQEYKVQIVPSILTGWMSFALLVPPAIKSENVITSPLALMWSVRFIKRFVCEFKHHKSIVAWCLGNECNCMGKVESREQAWVWNTIMSDAIKSCDNTRPVIHGMHSLGNPNEEKWYLQDAGESCDILTTHPYASPSYGTDKDIINTFKPVLHTVSQTLYYKGVGNKPTFIEETGTYGEMNVSENLAGLYCKSSMFSAWVHNCLGYLWWLGYDQGSLEYFPYKVNNRASNYGLFREDRSEKPVGKSIREFSEWLDNFEYKTLPERIVDAVCIVPTNGGNYIQQFASAFILAKQAGVDMEFVYAPDKLPDAKAYILPSIQSPHSLHAEYLQSLMKKVEEGALLYVSVGNGYLRNMNKDFGFDIIFRHPVKAEKTVTIGDCSFNIKPKYHFEVNTTKAQIIGTNEAGEGVYYCSRYGKGTVMFLSYDVEEYLSDKVNAFENTNFYKVYEEIKKRIESDKIANCTNPNVGMTEHILNDNERLVTISNYSNKIVNCEITVENGWSFSRVLYNNAQKSSNGALVELDLACSSVLVFSKN